MPDEDYVVDPAEYSYGGHAQPAMNTIAEMLAGEEGPVREGDGAEPSEEA
jgi:hypothetical protein